MQTKNVDLPSNDYIIWYQTSTQERGHMHTLAFDEDKDMLTLCTLDCFEETSNIQEESRERKPPLFEERETAKACVKQSNVYPPTLPQQQLPMLQICYVYVILFIPHPLLCYEKGLVKILFSPLHN